MEMYKLYIEEKIPGESVHYTNEGFIQYRFTADFGLWIEILFVKEEYRRAGKGTQLMEDLLSRYPEINHIMCHIDSESHNPTKPLVNFCNYGFEVVGIKDRFILLYRRIK